MELLPRERTQLEMDFKKLLDVNQASVIYPLAVAAWFSETNNSCRDETTGFGTAIVY
jgi:hypothetical protein